jgi:Glycosyl-4,4'-diaponeurosporenoate acyltransferase
VSADLSPKANPMGAFQSVWYRLALLFCAMYLTVFWFVFGPSNPWYGLMVAWGTSSLQPVLAGPLTRPLPRQWFRVPDGERVLHRVLGIRLFWWLLDVIGWNRLIKRMRAFSGTKPGLVSLGQSARAGAIAHAICFAIHVVLAVCALSTKHPWSGALWMLLPAVIPHVYPVFMQRSIMLRLQPLLDNAAARRPMSN